MIRPDYAKIVTVCPNCNEAVEITITKKEAKIIYQGFKTPHASQLKMEKLIEKRNQKLLYVKELKR